MIQLAAKCIHRRAPMVSVTVGGKPLRCLPSAHRAFAATQVRRNLLPRIKTFGRGQFLQRRRGRARLGRRVRRVWHGQRLPGEHPSTKEDGPSNQVLEPVICGQGARDRYCLLLPCPPPSYLSASATTTAATSQPRRRFGEGQVPANGASSARARLPVPPCRQVRVTPSTGGGGTSCSCYDATGHSRFRCLS